MLWGEAYALWRHQVDEGITERRQMGMNGRHHFLCGVRAGNREYLRMCLLNDIALGAETAGDDHAAVLRQRFADGVQRLLYRRIDEAAGIDHDQIGALVGARNGIAFGAQPGQYLFGIDRGLGTA